MLQTTVQPKAAPQASHRDTCCNKKLAVLFMFATNYNDPAP